MFDRFTVSAVFSISFIPVSQADVKVPEALARLQKSAQAPATDTAWMQLSLADIHNIQGTKTASAEQTAALCKSLESRWPKALEHLRNAKNDEGATARQTVHKHVAAKILLCTPNRGTAKIWTALSEIQKAAPGLAPWFYNARVLSALLPVEKTGLSIKKSLLEGNIEPYRYINAHFAEISDSMSKKDCAIGNFEAQKIPAKKECFASWMYWVFSESPAMSANAMPAAESTALAKRVENAVAKHATTIGSWPNAFTKVFQDRKSGSVLVAQALVKQPNSSFARLVLHETPQTAPVFVLTEKQTKDVASCQDWQSKMATALKNPGNKVLTPTAMQFVGGLTSRICPTEEWSHVFPVLAQSINKNILLRSSLIERRIEHPVQAVREGREDDFDLREQLNLKFHLGGDYDAEEVAALAAEDIRYAALDSVIAKPLRLGKTPWVFFDHNPNRPNQSREVGELLMLRLGQQGAEGRLLQLQYTSAVLTPQKTEAPKTDTSRANLAKIAEIEKTLRSTKNIDWNWMKQNRTTADAYIDALKQLSQSQRPIAGSQQLAEMAKARTALFHWFLATQERRLPSNSEYSKGIHDRFATLKTSEKDLVDFFKRGARVTRTAMR